jgi:hypothetical protein
MTDECEVRNTCSVLTKIYSQAAVSLTLNNKIQGGRSNSRYTSKVVLFLSSGFSVFPMTP